MSGLTSSTSKSIGGTDNQQRNSPADWAAAGLQTAVQQAGNQYWNAQDGSNWLTKQAQDIALQRVNNDGNPFGLNLYSTAANLAGSGGLTPAQQATLSGLQATTQRQANTQGGALQGLVDGLSGPSAASTYGSSIAGGAAPNWTGLLSNILSGGGPLATASLNGIGTGALASNGLANVGAGPLATGGLKDIVSPAGLTAAREFLTGMADGGMVGDNPYVSAILNSNADRIGNRMASSMSGAGRYGSFAHGDALARSISDANNPIAAQFYESDRNRQLQAAGLIDSSDRAREASRISAAGTMDSASRAQDATRIGALSQMDAARRAQDATRIAGTTAQDAASRALDSSRTTAATAMDSATRAAEANRLAAAGLIDASNLSRTQARAGILNDMGGIQERQRGTEAQGLLNVFQGQQQGVNNIGNLAAQSGAIDNARYADANTFAKIGQDRTNAERTALNSYIQQLRALSDGYGTTDQEGVSIQKQTSQQSPMQSIAGGISMLSGLGGLGKGMGSGAKGGFGGFGGGTVPGSGGLMNYGTTPGTGGLMGWG